VVNKRDYMLYTKQVLYGHLGDKPTGRHSSVNCVTGVESVYVMYCGSTSYDFIMLRKFFTSTLGTNLYVI